MPSERVADILDHIRAFHRRLRETYEDLENGEKDERVKLLLEYMGRHEAAFDKAIKRYEKTAQEAVLKTWLKYSASTSPRQVLERVEISPEMDAGEIIQAAMEFDKALIDLYSELANLTAVPKVRELFESLMLMEESKDHQYIRRKLETEDVMGED